MVSTDLPDIKNSFDPGDFLLRLLSSNLSYLLVAFVVTRIVLISVGLLANTYVPGVYGPEYRRLENPVLDLGYRWDGVYYAAIANWGFAYTYNGDEPDTDMAFMPLYPALIRITNYLLGCNQYCYENHLIGCGWRECSALSGMIISNISLFGAGYLLFKLTQQQSGIDVARRAVWLLMVAPNAIFFFADYTESLFLLLALLTFWALNQNQFGLAVAAASAASLTRVPGLALYPPLIIYAWRHYRSTQIWNLFLAHIPPLSFFGYILIAGLIVGDPLAYFAVNDQQWGHSPANGPWAGFAIYMQPANQIRLVDDRSTNTWLDLIFTICYLLILIPIIRRDIQLGSYSAGAIILPILLGTLLTMPRFGGVMFPIYMVLSQWADTRLKQAVVFCVSISIAVFFAIRFVTWKWVA